MANIRVLLFDEYAAATEEFEVGAEYTAHDAARLFERLRNLINGNTGDLLWGLTPVCPTCGSSSLIQGDCPHCNPPVEPL